MNTSLRNLIISEHAKGRSSKELWAMVKNPSFLPVYPITVPKPYWVMTCLDADYPPLLREISDPPAVLYGLGKRAMLSERAIAMVGSRRGNPYGLHTAFDLSAKLAEAGLCIISGLALGIDAKCHEGALSVRGKTVAVLGCGINVVYPKRNAALFGQIAKKGAVVTEFAPGEKPLADNFRRRNRIISGLSKGVVVVQATKRSGTMITVRFAAEQGRDVFAVPGNIDSAVNRGSNELIAKGAIPVLGVEDILYEVL